MKVQGVKKYVWIFILKSYKKVIFMLIVHYFSYWFGITHKGNFVDLIYTLSRGTEAKPVEIFMKCFLGAHVVLHLVYRREWEDQPFLPI